MALLKVKNINVRYGGISALEDISFNVHEGRIIALIGANGAGKSTCLRAISGLVPLWSGEIWFKDIRIDTMRTEKIVGLGISHIPEGRRLFPLMTVNDNLLTGSFLRKDPAEISNNLTKTYSNFTSLKKKRKQVARKLSGGQQQMVACGRGIMANADLMLFDEPSLGLAPMLVKEVGEYIKLFASEGKTIILVEQNAHMALSIATEAYVLEKGKIVFHGKPDDLSNNDYVKKAYLGI